MGGASPPAAGTARGTLIGVIALLMWSTLAVLTAASGTAPPFFMVAVAFSVAFLAALAKWTWRRESPWRALRQPPAAWALGVGGLFGYHVLVFLALKTAPPVEANLINYLWPLLIVLFSGLLPGHSLRWFHVAGTLCGLAGTVVLVSGGGALGFRAEYLTGYAAALAAALVWSSYSVLNRLFANVPSDAVGGFCAVGALLALGCHLAFEPSAGPFTAGQWLALLALGLGPAGGAFFFWDHGVKHGNITRLGVLSYGTPLASTLLLIALGPGRLTWPAAVAAVFIIGGALLASLDVLRRRAP